MYYRRARSFLKRKAQDLNHMLTMQTLCIYVIVSFEVNGEFCPTSCRMPRKGVPPALLEEQALQILHYLRLLEAGVGGISTRPTSFLHPCTEDLRWFLVWYKSWEFEAVDTADTVVHEAQACSRALGGVGRTSSQPPR